MKKLLLLVAMPALLLSACKGESGPPALYISQNVPAPQPQQLLGGILGDAILDLKLEAQGENIDVRKLTFTATGANASNASVNVQHLAVYHTGSLLASAGPIGMATPAGCGASYVPGDFCLQLSNPLSISKGSFARLLVKPYMNTDAEGAMRGQNVQFAVASEQGDIVAIEKGGYTNLQKNNGDGTASGEIIVGRTNAGPEMHIVSSKNILVLSKITSITNASPDANGSAIPVGPDRAIGQFKFTAAHNNNAWNGLNKVYINDLILSVSVENVSIGTDSFFIYNKADPTVKRSCTVISGPPGTMQSSSGGPIGDTTSVGIYNATNGLLQVHCGNMAGGTLNASIPSAGEITFVLETDVFVASVDPTKPSRLSVSLYNVDTYREGPADTIGVHDSHIQWLDRDVGFALTSHRWADIDLNGGNTIQSTQYVGGSISSSSSSIQTSSFSSQTSSTSSVSSHAGGPTVYIAHRAGISADSVVKNQKNVSLLRFEASLAGTGSIALEKVTVVGTGGTNLNNMHNYSLWTDVNGDGTVDLKLEAQGVVQGNQITFHDVGRPLSQALTIAFEVHADVASSYSGTQQQFQIALSTANGAYGATNINNGQNPASSVAVNGQCNAGPCGFWLATGYPATRYTLRDQGDLYVSKSVTPIPRRQLLGGALEDDILRLKLAAHYENIQVRNLTFTATGADAQLFTQNVKHLELYKVGSVTPFMIASRGQCAQGELYSACTTFSSSGVVVPKGNDVEIIVRPRMNTDAEGALSGKNVQILFDGRNAGSIVGGSLYAVGLTSNRTLSPNDQDTVAEGEIFVGRAYEPGPDASIVGISHVTTFSKFTTITNANPAANGSAIPFGIQPVGQFKFAAAPANNTKNGQNSAEIYGIIFDVDATNVLVATGSARVYNKANVAAKANCFMTGTEQGDGVTGDIVVTCTDLIDQSIDTRIEPGTDATLVLELQIADTKINESQNSDLRVSFTNFTSQLGVPPTDFGPSASHIKWFDRDNGGSTQFLWIDYPETTVHSTSYAN